MAAKYHYFLKIEYVEPRSGKHYHRIMGPVRSRKTVDTLYLSVIKKRNIVNTQTTKEPYEH